MPTAVDNMPASDVYMILYEIRAQAINTKMAKLKKDTSGSEMSVQTLDNKYGDVG